MKLLEIINQKIKEDNEKDKHPFSGRISASSLGQCYRRQYYNFHRVEPTNPPDERLFRVFRAGDLFHDFVQDILIQKGYKKEQPFKDDRLSIRVDLVNDEEVVEIKSVHSFKFHHTKRELKTKKLIDINPDHVYQVCIGAICLKKEYAHLIYVSKDDLCIMEFKIKIDDEIRERTLKEVDTVWKHVNHSHPPEDIHRLYGDKVDKKTGLPKECSYCNWKERCFNEPR